MNQPPNGSTERTGWWDRLDRLVEEAGALPPSERAAFLDRVCPDDPAMRAEAASLLAHTDSGERLMSAIAASLPLHVDAAEGLAGLDPYVGRTIQHYAIESVLGWGGMGVVYRARDLRLGRTVALKFIRPHRHADASGRQRLLVEAQAAAALDHPNVCTVHEVGEGPDGGLFIAMGFYEGETLKSRLARRPVTLDEAIDTIRQVAEGVRAAHARGILHCDIKPGNILITHDGVVKLLDFGIAERVNSLPHARGTAAGTTPYMSPEHIRGDPLDERSDIWSLGVVAYEMLASRRPFRGNGSTGTMQAVLDDAPAQLVGARKDLSPALESVIRRALAKDPAGRQQSVEGFLAELHRAVAGREVGAPGMLAAASVRRRWSAVRSRPWFAFVLGVGLLLLSSPLVSRTRGVAMVGGGLASVSAGETGERVESGPASIAVLRFEDPAAETQSWVTEGIREAIEAELRHVDGLRVVAHFSSMMSSDVPPADALFGGAPGGRYLLSGSLRRSGDSIRIAPQLVDAASGTVLWDAAYSGALTPESVGEVAGAVAREAARMLALRPSPARERPGTLPDPAAWESYLEGRYHLRRFQSGVAMVREELDTSVAYLRTVVDRAPSWAPGHAALGEALSWIGMFEAEQGRLDAAFAEASGVLDLALRLDPGDARAQATLGYVLHRKDLDFDAAEARFRRAMELDPDQYWHCGYGFFLLWSGRYEEAARVYRRAEARDPLYLTLKDFLAASYLCTGQYEEAIATSEALLAMAPAMMPVRRSLVLALQASGRDAEAFARIDEATQPDHPYWDVLRALLHARSGRRAEAESLLRGLDEAAVTTAVRAFFPARQVSPAPLYAAVLVALDRPEDAITMLTSALDSDPAVLLYDRCYPELAVLQDDPRYQALLRRSGIPF